MTANKLKICLCQTNGYIFIHRTLFYCLQFAITICFFLCVVRTIVTWTFTLMIRMTVWRFVLRLVWSKTYNQIIHLTQFYMKVIYWVSTIFPLMGERTHTRTQSIPSCHQLNCFPAIVIYYIGCETFFWIFCQTSASLFDFSTHKKLRMLVVIFPSR